MDERARPEWPCPLETPHSATRARVRPSSRPRGSAQLLQRRQGVLLEEGGHRDLLVEILLEQPRALLLAQHLRDRDRRLVARDLVMLHAQTGAEVERLEHLGRRLVFLEGI